MLAHFVILGRRLMQFAYFRTGYQCGNLKSISPKPTGNSWPTRVTTSHDSWSSFITNCVFPYEVINAEIYNSSLQSQLVIHDQFVLAHLVILVRRLMQFAFFLYGITNVEIYNQSFKSQLLFHGQLLLAHLVILGRRLMKFALFHMGSPMWNFISHLVILSHCLLQFAFFRDCQCGNLLSIFS